MLRRAICGSAKVGYGRLIRLGIAPLYNCALPRSGKAEKRKLETAEGAPRSHPGLKYSTALFDAGTHKRGSRAGRIYTLMCPRDPVPASHKPEVKERVSRAQKQPAKPTFAAPPFTMTSMQEGGFSLAANVFTL